MDTRPQSSLRPFWPSLIGLQILPSFTTSRHSCSRRWNKATHWASCCTIGKPTILQKLLIILDTHLNCSPSSSTLVNTLSFTALGSHQDSGTHSKGPLSYTPLPKTPDTTLLGSHGRSKSSNPPLSDPSTQSNLVLPLLLCVILQFVGIKIENAYNLQRLKMC